MLFLQLCCCNDQFDVDFPSRHNMFPYLCQHIQDGSLESKSYTCLVCSNILTSDTTPCMICSLSYHLGCVDINKGTCYACLGNQHQIDHYNSKFFTIEMDPMFIYAKYSFTTTDPFTFKAFLS
jgi:hypothetical protein